MLTRVKALLDLPQAERNPKIRRGLKNHFRQYLSKIVYSTFGYWLNRMELPYVLEHRPDSHYDFEQIADYPQLLRGWIAGNRPNCGDLSRFYSLYLNVNRILADDIPGAFVELGVYKGNSAFMLATLARRADRHVYLFDTFGGFDRRDLRGLDSKSLVSFTDTSLAGVQALVGTDGVTYVEGFFPESADKVTLPDRIAVAHIDCDLYEPMKAALERFYPRLSPGGIMLLHDYSSGHWLGATRAVDEFFDHVPDKPILLPDKSGTAIVRKTAR